MSGPAAEAPPRLRPGLTLAADGDVTWVRVNTRVLRLRGEGARRILEAIDGSRGVDDLATAVGGAPGEVAAVLERFRGFGLLEPEGCGAAHPLAGQLRALADLGVDAAALSAELAGAHVGVAGEGALAGAVEAALARAGVGRVGGDVDEVDALVAAPGGDRALLEALNARALRRGLPWILVEAGGFDLRVGPFFLPGETACWRCLELRLEAAEPGGGERRAARAAFGRAPALTDDLVPGVAAVAAEACALEVVRFFAARVSDVGPELYGAFAEYSLLRHRAAPHPVLRLPRCPACGARAAGLPTVRAWMEPYEYRDAR